MEVAQADIAGVTPLRTTRRPVGADGFGAHAPPRRLRSYSRAIEIAMMMGVSSTALRSLGKRFRGLAVPPPVVHHHLARELHALGRRPAVQLLHDVQRGLVV